MARCILHRVNHLLARRAAAVHIAREAGRCLLGYLGKLEGYSEKSRANLVSEADLASEALVRNALERAFPDDQIVAEERDGLSGALARRGVLDSADYAWAVDPLDGTTNFVHGYPNFCVSMGLLARGRPVLGVIYSPYRDELFTGGEGLPAELNGQPISVSKPQTLDRALVGTGFVFMEDSRLDRVLAILREVLRTSHGVRRAGSAALDLCDVATGRLDAFYETGLAPWDVVAGQAIVEAAGGQVTNFGGEVHDVYGQNVLASNGPLHPAMLELLARFK
jgi:myo-inositol-1(or 4)-monophosphatase